MVLGTKKAIISLISLGRIRQTIGKKNSKNRKKTNRRLTSTILIYYFNIIKIIWRIFAKPNNPSAPKFDIDEGKHVLACF